MTWSAEAAASDELDPDLNVVAVVAKLLEALLRLRVKRLVY
jgi:hypothetical protein